MIGFHLLGWWFRNLLLGLLLFPLENPLLLDGVVNGFRLLLGQDHLVGFGLLWLVGVGAEDLAEETGYAAAVFLCGVVTTKLWGFGLLLFGG